MGQFQPETPLSRSAELDFGFLPVATPAGMHTCYLKLKLSTIAANHVAFLLSCKTLLGQAWGLTFRQKRSLEQLLPVLLSRIHEAA